MIRERTFTTMKIEDVMSLVVVKPTTIHADATMNELLAKVNEDKKTRHVYVIDDSNTLCGEVRMTSVVEYLFPFTSMMLHARDMTVGNIQNIKAQKVDQIMNHEPICLKYDSTMADAAQILIKEKINELPIVDDQMKLVGQINVYELITAYLDEQNKTEL